MKKLKQIRFARVIIQIFFFFLAPAVFASTFNGLKGLFSELGAGEGITYSVSLGLCLSLIIYVFLFGRFFCGWACSFGAISDWLFYLGRKIPFIKKTKLKTTSLEKHFYLIKYLILAGILIISFLGMRSILTGKDPWDVFALLLRGKFIPGYTIAWILFIAIMLFSLFRERFFCRYLCPMGAIYSIAERFSVQRIKKERSECGNCRACSSVCPVRIDLSQTDYVKSGECIHCMNCNYVCPKGNPLPSILKKEYGRIIYLITAFIALLVIYYAFGVISFKGA